jgi:hypothetical protein
MVRLYSLEALIDNTVFQGYSQPSQLANASYNSLYMAQRQFDTIAINDASRYSLYYLNLCDSTTMSQIQNMVKLFPAASYSAQECQNIL